MRQKNIFGAFLADWPQFSATKLQMKFQNLQKFWMKIQKICISFNQMWSHHVSKTEKNFESFI